MITSVNNTSSSSVTKTTAKPPPPVPPRPSKDIVAEALRKRRNPEDCNNATFPVRMAPPPPLTNYYTRSISNELKSNSRTVIFQSSNIMKKTSENTIPVTQINEEFSVKSTENGVKITQNSSRHSSESSNDDVNVNKVTCTVQNELSDTPNGTLKNTNELNESDESCKNDKSHVNMLIDEMFASVLDDQNEDRITINNNNEKNSTINNNNKNNSTILIIETNNNSLDFSNFPKSNESTMEKKKDFSHLDDKKNAELLIEELASMRIEQERISKRQRKPSREIYKEGDKEELYIDNLNAVEYDESIFERLKMMSSLHGLPPLPKSLSGFNINENFSNPPTPLRTSSIRGSHQTTNSIANVPDTEHLVYPPHHNKNSTIGTLDVHGRQQTNLDTQLAILRREMYSLRQLDLSLLSQLWSLNESIQDFRQILQDQEDCRILSPPSPSPAPSSGDEGDADDYYVNTPSTPMTTNITSHRFRPAPPPPPISVRRPNSTTSSNTSTGGVSETSH